MDSFVVFLASNDESWRRRGHLFIVADGMGAHAAGELASKLAVDTIPHTYHKLRDPNATALALDPVPRIAGTASSLITAMQNLAGSLGSFIAALIYDGSIARIVVILGVSGASTAFLFFVCRRAILGNRPLHVAHSDN